MKVGTLQTFANWSNWTCRAAITTFFYVFVGVTSGMAWDLVSAKLDEKGRAEAQAVKAESDAKLAKAAADMKADDDYWQEWLKGCLTENKKYKCQFMWHQAGMK